MDKLLEEDDISTKNGLRFAFTVLREAFVTLRQVEERVKQAEGAYRSVAKNSSDVLTKLAPIEKRVNAMWAGYQVGLWVASAIGVSVIGLIWSLITGVATINFVSGP